MNKQNARFFGGLTVALLGIIWIVAGGGTASLARGMAAIGFGPPPANLGPFVSCLKDKGVTFYGAFWCPHCEDQKAMFGTSAGQLPYVECSTPDGANQLQVCKDKNIKGYPTWEFADGSRQSGEVPLKELSGKTDCPLPP